MLIRIPALLIVAMGFASTVSANTDPTGLWSCVVYGPGESLDEHVLLRVDAGGRTFSAPFSATQLSWRPLSDWESRRGELRFVDFRTARTYLADLDYATLGGRWETVRRTGGWFCSRVEADMNSDFSLNVDAADVRERALMPPLIPEVMATPWYPRQAIREAKEGHAVICFLVGADGFTRDAEFIELSDDIFELPSRGALSRSRYAGWLDKDLLRPGCRRFEYHLDQVPR